MEGKIGPTADQHAKGAKGANLFIPISLGNHYYSSVVLQNLMDDFISSSNRSIIFLCDRLRFLSYRIRGEVDIKGINSRIQIQIDQMKRTLDNLGLGSHPNAFVADWSFLEEDHRYGELLASLGEFVQADREVGECLNDRVATLIDRFYRRESSELVELHGASTAVHHGRDCTLTLHDRNQGLQCRVI